MQELNKNKTHVVMLPSPFLYRSAYKASYTLAEYQRQRGTIEDQETDLKDVRNENAPRDWFEGKSVSLIKKPVSPSSLEELK